MDSNEKIELLKNTIEQLYTKEGKSLNYISNLIDVDSRRLSNYIKNIWKLDPPKTNKLKPSRLKYLNSNKDYIINSLNSNIPINEIMEKLNVTRKELIDKYILQDNKLKNIYYSYLDRINKKEERYTILDESTFDRNEIWKDILGYDIYQVSNKGNVRKKIGDHTYQLLHKMINVKNNRLYVSFQTKTFQVSRLVGFAFLSGYSEVNNTINHKDGNVQNNCVENLEWVSQSNNLKHSYDNLNRKTNIGKKTFDKIIYNNKYEFKTVASLARFLNKSETQVRRYLENPEKYNLKIINNCND